MPADVVLNWARAIAPAPETAILAGAGHFFHGRIHELRDAVLKFMGPEAAAPGDRRRRVPLDCAAVRRRTKP